MLLPACHIITLSFLLNIHRINIKNNNSTNEATKLNKWNKGERKKAHHIWCRVFTNDYRELRIWDIVKGNYLQRQFIFILIFFLYFFVFHFLFLWSWTFLFFGCVCIFFIAWCSISNLLVHWKNDDEINDDEKDYMLVMFIAWWWWWDFINQNNNNNNNNEGHYQKKKKKMAKERKFLMTKQTTK